MERSESKRFRESEYLADQLIREPQPTRRENESRRKNTCEFPGCPAPASVESGYGVCRLHQKQAVNLYYEAYETDTEFQKKLDGNEFGDKPIIEIGKELLLEQERKKAPKK